MIRCTPLAAIVAATAVPLFGQVPSAAGAAPRLTLDVAALGASVPEPLRGGCGTSDPGLGFALGAGFRVAPGIRAEARAGAFGQLGGSDCVTAPLAAPNAPQPWPPPPPGSVTRSSDFDPTLRGRNAFAQGRLVGEVTLDEAVLRAAAGGGTLLGVRAPFASGALGVGQRFGGLLLAAELERWWLSLPGADRTTTWVADTTGRGFAATVPRVTERRFRRSSRTTWLRVGVTIRMPGT